MNFHMVIANFDYSRLPIVLITTTAEEPTELLFDEFLKGMNKTVQEATGKIVIITDLSNARFLPADLRIKMGNWYKNNDAILKEKVVGMVIINKSMVMNVVIRGVFFIKKPAVPTEIFSTLEQGMKWSEEKLSVLI